VTPTQKTNKSNLKISHIHESYHNVSNWLNEIQMPVRTNEKHRSTDILTVTGGFRQYIWCPRSQASHSSMCSPSPLRRQMRQYACSDDRDQATLVSSTEQWTQSCERLVDNSSDSSQRSNAVRSFFARDSASTLAILPSAIQQYPVTRLQWNCRSRKAQLNIGKPSKVGWDLTVLSEQNRP